MNLFIYRKNTCYNHMRFAHIHARGVSPDIRKKLASTDQLQQHCYKHGFSSVNSTVEAPVSAAFCLAVLGEGTRLGEQTSV